MNHLFKKSVALLLAAWMLLCLMPAALAADAESSDSIVYATQEELPVSAGSMNIISALYTANNIHYCTICEDVYYTAKHTFVMDEDHDGDEDDKAKGIVSWHGGGQSLKFMGAFVKPVNLTEDWQDSYLEFDLYISDYEEPQDPIKTYTSLNDFKVSLEISSSGVTDNLERSVQNLKLTNYVKGGLKKGGWNHVSIPMSVFRSETVGGVTYQSSKYGILGSDGKYHFDWSRCNYFNISNEWYCILPGGVQYDLKNVRFRMDASCAHQYDSDWTTDEYVHYVSCTLCGAHLSEEQHAYGPQWNVDETGHSKTCGICGYTLTGEHSFDKAWHADGEQHWHECRVCGTKDRLTAHEWGEGTVTVAATEQVPGVVTYTCDVCDAARDEQTDRLPKQDPPADDPSDEPTTDDPATSAPTPSVPQDRTTLTLIIVAVAIAVVGAVAVILILRSGKKKQ